MDPESGSEHELTEANSVSDTSVSIVDTNGSPMQDKLPGKIINITFIITNKAILLYSFLLELEAILFLLILFIYNNNYCYVCAFQNLKPENGYGTCQNTKDK